MYEALTVAPRELSALERECVWLCLLVAAQEAIGTHHLELFRAAKGTDADAVTLIALAGAAPASDALDFAGRHWAPQLPELDPAAAWDATVAALRGGIDPALADLCLLTVQAARNSRSGVARQLRRLYGKSVAEPRIVEALSYVMWPRGVNAFLEACEVWHELMAAGEVTPSPLFAAWRDMPGLGTFDPASGRSVAGFRGEEE
jgi:alkylhydroperoxidase/carboxymuconolactone decarboxylase family protein YurZ